LRGLLGKITIDVTGDALALFGEPAVEPVDTTWDLAETFVRMSSSLRIDGFFAITVLD
jgi:hypothetical protein